MLSTAAHNNAWPPTRLSGAVTLAGGGLFLQ